MDRNENQLGMFDLSPIQTSSKDFDGLEDTYEGGEEIVTYTIH